MGVYRAGILLSTANDSLSLMNKKWDSVMCPQGDSNDMTWHIKEQFSNEKFGGNQPYGRLCAMHACLVC